MKKHLEKIENATLEEMKLILASVKKNKNIIGFDVSTFDDIKFFLLPELLEEFDEYYYENIDEEIQEDELESIRDSFAKYLEVIDFPSFEKYVQDSDNLYNYNRWLLTHVEFTNLLEWIDFDLDYFFEEYFSSLNQQCQI
jgi:hypothetical protein